MKSAQIPDFNCKKRKGPSLKPGGWQQPSSSNCLQFARNCRVRFPSPIVFGDPSIRTSLGDLNCNMTWVKRSRSICWQETCKGYFSHSQKTLVKPKASTCLKCTALARWGGTCSSSLTSTPHPFWSFFTIWYLYLLWAKDVVSCWNAWLAWITPWV